MRSARHIDLFDEEKLCKDCGAPIMEKIGEACHAGFISDILADYRGIVITDGYSGYDRILAGLPIMHAGCSAHARRYFIEALEAAHAVRRLPVCFTL